LSARRPEAAPAESSIPKDERTEVWKRDRGRCVICGSNQELKFKHIVSISKGGQEVAENIRLVCKPCRHRKASTTQESA
jgi:5-methylcytosine-specific restriction endonuclease McrA